MYFVAGILLNLLVTHYFITNTLNTYIISYDTYRFRIKYNCKFILGRYCKIYREKDTQNKIETEPTLVLPVVPLPKTLTYREQVANRLKFSIEAMSSSSEELSVSIVCELLNYSSVSLIENYFSGAQEPTLEFLKKYSDFFGIEINWLRHGKRHVFKRHNTFPTDPIGYKGLIIDLSPEKIYFVRSKSENGDSGIILKLAEYKYLILPRTYYLSSHVGGTGMCQIESFYDLIYNLSNSNQVGKLNGLMLSEKSFNDLFRGDIFAGKLIDSNRSARSYWWDDFLDIEHKYPISEYYQNDYGIEFVKAQQIVKWRKEKNFA